MKQSIEFLQSFWAINRITSKLTQLDAANAGLTLQQLAILNVIRFHPELKTLKQLTDRLLTAKSTLSISIDGLVALGYLTREPSTEDRREIILSLTPQGHKLSQTINNHSSAHHVMETALESMNPEDVETLLRLLKTLHTQLYSLKAEVH
ncbi:MarR family winged helix-turn-helix transcriptional regulator [Brevibacillus laterosporus]|uniref:MarR family winged helix-turn-helix transcriptional regulator n=1 Tax=Brevibacillus laterosporus TaxID=1465 RepID=UPI000B9BA0AA|nr:MarR family winged helix-turn-helix transcriptional regulator [Brevibacillus laterosporus]MBG9788576.1 MarR family transcriptional regulator [Brevibacillus laterosporus]MCG7319366.1 MarR family winged helix-turn-helix transcriptional regulator [Brevibacillus laterosporus]MED1787839.1 MarR family winged helix-turn-helix transcriptional regulator [Brevibacillus laterosporus]